MVQEAQIAEVWRWRRPQDAARLTGLPVELLRLIVRLSLAVGRERDVSALARTSKHLSHVVQPELYRLVIRYRTFHIVNWAAANGRMGTLETALANGADPNEMLTLGCAPSSLQDIYRPAGWGLNSAQRLDRAVRARLADVYCPAPQLPMSRVWGNAWFSSPSLSMASTAHLARLWHHYHETMRPHDGSCFSVCYEQHNQEDDQEDDTRLDDLSDPLDDSFAFPGNMSREDMDTRDVKLGFVRLFRRWSTPLHAAARYDRRAAAVVLLAGGADVDSTAVQGCLCSKESMPSSVPGSPPGNRLIAYTALHIAICSGSYAAARALVARGAQRMAMMFSGGDDRGWLSENALHAALYTCRGRVLDYAFVEFLLAHGYAARVEERNHENLTPLLIACNAVGDPAQEDVVRLLLRSGADTESQGSCPTRSRNVFTGPMPVAGVEELATPALWAARRGQFRLAKLLLDHGADMHTRSSAMRVTMLHAVCTRTIEHGIHQDRIELLDHLLANSTARDLNAFDGASCTPLTMLIRWNFSAGGHSYTSDMESKLFANGADILAGITVGRRTPLESIIEEGLATCTDADGSPGIAPDLVGDKALATMRASGVARHSRRPTAFLNHFWGYLEMALMVSLHGRSRAPATREVGACMLHALIKAGFSPAEVDRNGDTAMTSFLKLLLWNPALATCDRHPRAAEGWLIQSAMALLQENGAALDLRDNRHHTAFDYLRQITGYSGQDPALFFLSRVVGRQVRPGRDQYGGLCFKFHPTKRLFGKLNGDATLSMISRKQSRWLVCEHWCRNSCGSSRAADGQCRCARTPFKTLAACDGDCSGENGMRRPWI